MKPDTTRSTYTIDELAHECDVPGRTLRSWIRVGILPRPLGKGRGARYDQRHYLRGRAAARLRTNERLTLRAVRARLEGLTDDQLRALAPPQKPVTPEGVPLPPPKIDYPSVPWEVVDLMPGLVLLVNAAQGELVKRVASEIYHHYSVAPGGVAPLRV